MPTPLMRASHIQSNLASVEMLGAGEAHRVRHALGAGRVATIEEAGRMEWLPLEIDVALTDAVGEVAGMDGVRRWARTSIQQSLDGPLLGPLRDGAVRLFGLAPGKILEMGAPRLEPRVQERRHAPLPGTRRRGSSRGAPPPRSPARLPRQQSRPRKRRRLLRRDLRPLPRQRRSRNRVGGQDPRRVPAPLVADSDPRSHFSGILLRWQPLATASHLRGGVDWP